MLPSPILFLASDPRLESITSGFRRNRAEIDSADVVAFLVGAVVVAMVLWLIARWTDRRTQNDSRLRLFLSLAKAHRIGWRDRWLLWRIAGNASLAEPAVVFLDPRLTAPGGARNTDRSTAERLKQLRRRIFAGLEQTQPLPQPEAPIGAAIDRVHASLDRLMPKKASDETDSGPPPPVPRNSPESPDGGQTPAELNDAEDTTGPSCEDEPSILPMRNRGDRNRPAPPDADLPGAAGPAKRKPSAEFPEQETPVLDLYPWLGSNWQLGTPEKDA